MNHLVDVPRRLRGRGRTPQQRSAGSPFLRGPRNPRAADPWTGVAGSPFLRGPRNRPAGALG